MMKPRQARRIRRITAVGFIVIGGGMCVMIAPEIALRTEWDQRAIFEIVPVFLFGIGAFLTGIHMLRQR
jgi:hypothetical protein